MSGSAALTPARFFEPDRILKVLAEHGVRYVLVGGIAATLRGSPSMTYDIDVAPELSGDNLERLAAALRELGAVRYTEPEEDIAAPYAEEMSARVEQFASPIGYIDVLRELRAIGGYERLIEAAELIEVAGTSVYVAALDDIIASKEAAGRPKDLAQLPALYALRDELRHD
ncbi:MAG: nucleotidyltransferase family protein [Actinobacteria bacterium]|nr:nucleotidyltransferase family protein [Actinomycetota bacterium]